jgi:hypothetical protein
MIADRTEFPPFDAGHFRLRVLRHALTEAAAEATAEHWLRRAVTFENARPRPGDYIGRATAQDLAQRDARCAAIAQACRNRASLALTGAAAPQDALVAAVVAEVA